MQMLYTYTIKWWDAYYVENTASCESGIVAASDYGEAMKRLSECYGDGNIITIQLTEINPILTQEDVSETFEGLEKTNDIHG